MQARKKLYDVYSEKSLTEGQCKNSLARFRSGNFDLKDAPRFGRPTEVDDDKIKAMIENNRRNNIVQKRSSSKRDEPAQSTSKADIHQKKVMLSVWWDFKGFVYFELLRRNQTINPNVYYCQLMKLDKEIKKKRPELATCKGVIFHQDNARPLTTYIFGHYKKLLELSWKVMPHPPYSPELAPSNCHLFRSLQNHLNGKTSDLNEAVKNDLIQLFGQYIID